MTATPRRAQVVLGVIAILLLATASRLPVVALSPIADRIDADIPLSALALGMLGTAPPVAFAVAGLIGPRMRRALGLDSTLLVAMLIVLVGHVARAAATEYVGLLLATVVLLVGSGLATVLLPEAVKTLTPNRIGTMTAAYSIMMSVGTSVPPLIVVPLAEFGGWRWALGGWALFSVVAIAPWLILRRRSRRDHRAREAAGTGGARVVSVPHRRVPVRALLRSPTIWGIGIPFAVSSVVAYSSYALLAPLLRETAGATAAEAGVLLALLGIMGIPLSALIPPIVARLRTPTPLLITSTVLFAAGYLGLLLAPSAASFLWMTSLGLGFVTFPMCLTLFALRSRTPATATVVSGTIQGVGYAAAAFAPIALGGLRDATGSWSATLIVLTVLTLGNLVAIPLLARRGIVDDELAPHL